jgi:enamine deaminase RidA (YjgF/YER057c/UK114 family)
VRSTLRAVPAKGSCPLFANKVVNGCSDLLVAVFGDRGRRARAAVGVAALPSGASVEVDMIVEIVDR